MRKGKLRIILASMLSVGCLTTFTLSGIANAETLNSIDSLLNDSDVLSEPNEVVTPIEDSSEDSNVEVDESEDVEIDDSQEEVVSPTYTVLENRWDKSYTGALSSSATTKAIATLDGGYIVLACDGGVLSFNKFTSSGNLVWKVEDSKTKFLEITNAQLSADGGILVTGYSKKYLVTDENGIISDVNYSDENSSEVVEGNSTSADVREIEYGVISKYSYNGTNQWVASHEKDNGVYFNNSLELDDGSVVAVGYSLNARGEKNALAVKFDSTGELLWESSYNNVEGEFVDLVKKGTDLVLGYSGEGSLFGNTPAGGSDIVLVKYDTNGNTAEFKMLGGTEDEVLKGMALSKDDTILLMGSYKSSDVFGGFASDVDHSEMVLEVSNSFEPIWGYSVDYTLRELLVSIDGSLLLSGNSTSRLLSQRLAYVESVKKDQESTKLDFKFSGAKNDYAYTSLIQLTDNNIIGTCVITELKNSYLNVRSMNIGLDSYDSRQVISTVTLANKSIIDVVRSHDGKSLIIRLNKDGVYSDLSILENSTLKELTLSDEGFDLVYLNANGKEVKRNYDNDAKLLKEVVLTADDLTGEDSDSSNSNSGSNSNNGNNSNVNDSESEDESDDEISSDTDSELENESENDSEGNPSEDTTSQNSETSNVTDTPSSTINSSSGLVEDTSYSGTLPYTGIDGTNLILLIGACTLVGGLVIFRVQGKYYR